MDEWSSHCGFTQGFELAQAVHNGHTTTTRFDEHSTIISPRVLDVVVLQKMYLVRKLVLFRLISISDVVMLSTPTGEMKLIKLHPQ